MNRVERFVYDLVKRNPRLKGYVRDIYQRLYALKPTKDLESEFNILCREGYFFGYYDKSPWSRDNSLLLAHNFDIPLRMPEKDDHVRVGYFEGSNYRVLGTTRAWNWQQGSMLQWVGESSHIAFNDFDGQRHVAKIVDIDGQEVSRLPVPLAALSQDGNKGLSYSFERLRGCASGYSYANGPDLNSGVEAPSSDGLYLIEVHTGETNLLFSLQEMAGFQPEESMRGAYHYFNHCGFSPSGERLVFLHRWQQAGREWTRMISCNCQGEKLHIFPTSEMVSHFAWKDDHSILAWARVSDIGDRYYLFEDQKESFLVIGEDWFTSDGHPTYANHKRLILTDTYPDRSRISNLIVYDTVEEKRYDIAKLRSPFKYTGDVRCDLHPRWSPDDRMVCFDSVHTGQRSLCTVELPSNLLFS